MMRQGAGDKNLHRLWRWRCTTLAARKTRRRAIHVNARREDSVQFWVLMSVPAARWSSTVSLLEPRWPIPSSATARNRRECRPSQEHPDNLITLSAVCLAVLWPTYTESCSGS